MIIPHLIKYPLLTKKAVDFELFKLGVEIIDNQTNLKKDGLDRLVSIKSSMNKGLSEPLSKAFPSNIPITITKPIINSSIELSPYWITGFVTGEGCFTVGIKNRTFRAPFNISQHSKDRNLILAIKAFFEVGTMYIIKEQAINYTVNGYKENLENILPHFEQYPIPNVAHKYKQYQLWKTAILILKDQKHLTPEGRSHLMNIISELRV